MNEPKFDNLITVEAAMNPAAEYRILDCRAKLGDSRWGLAQFQTQHITGAHYLNLDEDLAAAPSDRGRHPLPARQDWLDCIGRLGIQPEQQVVLYDDAGGPYAARAWWMFRWIGHNSVAVLDGGLAAWLGAGGETTTGAAKTVQSTSFPTRPSLVKVTTTEDVLSSLDDRHILIDARTHTRYAGHEEPIDPVAGHIPGAVCMPFQDNLDDNGQFKSPQRLRERFVPLISENSGGQITCYCGSGVTAAHNILALHIAGYSDIALYPESWSGWITDPTRPISTQT